jgi:hypothetical protein
MSVLGSRRFGRIMSMDMKLLAQWACVLITCVCGYWVWAWTSHSDVAPYSPFMASLAFLLAVTLTIVAIRISPREKWRKAATEIGTFLAVTWTLVGIINPVFLSARAARTTTVCMSNAKHLALDLLIYEADSDDHFPPAKAWRTLSAYQEPTLRCPS